MNDYVKSEVLEHHGILGMKWGVRRYQPYDQGYQADHAGKYTGKSPEHDLRTQRELERREAKRQKAIDTLDYKEVMKHPERYSKDEIMEMAYKAKSVNELSNQMSTAKGRKFMNGANYLNTGLSVVRNTIGITSAALGVVLLADKVAKL